MPDTPKQKGTKLRQKFDKAFDTMSSKDSEFYNKLSDEAKKEWDQSMQNLKNMTPAERKRFYEENQIWLAKVFNYREKDEETGVESIIGKNQLGRKVAAFKRATEKQYTLNDMKQIAKLRSKKTSVKTSRPKKMRTPKLTMQQVDQQIADLERQLEQLKRIKAGL